MPAKNTTPAKKPSAKAEAKSSSPAVQKHQPPAMAASIEDQILQDAGMGQEEMTREDYSIPRLKILQDLSPQVKKTEPGFLKGAEVGMFCDPATSLLLEGDPGIQVIPVSYRRAYIEWWPRESKKGTGFVADHGSTYDLAGLTTKNEKGQNITAQGTQINVNGEYFVFLIKDGTHLPYVLTFTGTQLKKSRAWNTMINQLQVPSPKGGSINPAMFYRSYLLSTVPERNDHGSWMGFKITPADYTLQLEGGSDIYLAARAFRLQISTGAVKASAPSDDERHSGSGDGVQDDSAPM